MELGMEASSCCVCLNSASILYKITEKINDDEILTPIYKLLISVPDIDWLQIHQICNLCKDNLNKAYDFREICFKSEFLRCEIKIEEHKVERLDDDEIGDTKPPVENRKLRNVCNICSNITESLSNISKNAEEENSPSISKLKILIKNIDWADSFDICNLCEDRLNEAYDFHELCMKNQYNSLAIESKQIKIEPIDNDNVEIETGKHAILLDNVCTYCGCIFDSKQQLIVHLRTEHPSKIGRSKQQTNNVLNRFKCEYCKKPFKSNKSLRIHLATKHNIDRNKVLKHECHLCSERLLSPSGLKSHLNGVHLNISDFKCEQCNKAFKSDKRWRIHLAIKHNIERKKFLKHECHLCSKRFYSPSELKKHLNRLHLNICDFKCEQCNKAIKSNTGLRLHLAVKHNIDRKIVLKQECHLCSKRFYSSGELKSHLNRVHFNTCDFKCEQCSNEFKSKRMLQLHLAKVHEIRVNETLKHECRHCSERFIRPLDLKRHFDRVHLNVYDFKCEQCSNEFKSKHMLQLHLAKVHEIGVNETLKYECHLCWKRFLRPGEVKKHLRTAHLNV